MSPLEATIKEVKTEPRSGVDAALSLPTELIKSGNYASIDTALRSIFPSSQEETRLQKARAILGKIGAELPDHELELFLTKLQSLVDSWLDVYEKEVFEGQTLQEILIGK